MKFPKFIIVSDADYRVHLEDAYGLGYDRGIHNESYVPFLEKGIETHNAYFINMIRNLKSENEQLKAALIRKESLSNDCNETNCEETNFDYDAHFVALVNSIGALVEESEKKRLSNKKGIRLNKENASLNKILEIK